MKQEQVQKEKQSAQSKGVEKGSTDVKDLRNEALSEDIDNILDEIDSVLEENAQEFVAAYVQKGGE